MQQLKELFDRLQEERKPLAEKRDALSQERDAAIADETLTVKRDRELVAQIKEANNALYPVDMQIAALARALGGKKLSDGGQLDAPSAQQIEETAASN